jgi:hypothetical protein
MHTRSAGFGVRLSAGASCGPTPARNSARKLADTAEKAESVFAKPFIVGRQDQPCQGVAMALPRFAKGSARGERLMETNRRCAASRRAGAVSRDRQGASHMLPCHPGVLLALQL